MILLELFSWWYGNGWLNLSRKVGERTTDVLSFFSVGTLAATLFAPFRQISADQAVAGQQMRTFFDRLFSRFFGAVLRSVMIVVGLLLALLSLIFGLIQIVIWPLMPLLPVAGLVLMSMGWLPL